MKKIRALGYITIIVALLLCLVGCGGEISNVEETEALFIAEEIQQYTVYFDGGDGVSGIAPSSITIEAGKSFTVPENTFAKSGYEFYGYWTGWEYVFPGDTYVMKSQDLYFTAYWTAVSSSSSSSSSSSGGSSGSSSSSSSSSSSTTTSDTTTDTSDTTIEIEQLGTPVVSYSEGILSWDAIDNADFYTITIGDDTYFETKSTSG